MYYTRDSPLTITSEYVSTIQPKTMITTIVGSKTIINTQAIEPSKVAQPPGLTTKLDGKSDSAAGGGRTLRPTRKPGVSRFKPPVRTTEPPKTFKAATHRPKVPYKPSPTPPPDVLLESNLRPGGSSKKSTKVPPTPKGTVRPAILDIDQCKPACNAANKEVCKEFDGKFKCDCRAGYVRKAGSHICTGKFVLLLLNISVN